MVAPRPIRVALDAHVVGRRGTGNETYVVTLAEALAQHPGVDATILLDEGTAWPTPSVMDIHRLRTRTRFARIPLELPIAARRTGAQILHVQYVAPPLAGVPVVAAIHDLSFEDVPGIFPRATEFRLKLTVRATARRAAAIVAISEFTRSRLIERYALDPGKVFTTPVAAAPKWRPTRPDEQAACLDRLGLKGPFVLAVGNMHPRKNLARLVRAVAAIRSGTEPDLSLVLVGQRLWRANDVDAAIDAVGGRDWVTFTGFVDDDVLRSLYGAARVVAYVSLYEGLGLPVMEALACGAVVMASSTTAVPEAAGGAAVLVDPAHDDAVADGLRQALTDEALRARLVQAGPIHAATFTMDRFAESTVVAYRAALDSG